MRTERPRNAEVGEEHVAIGHQHVVGLDVAMNDAARVGMGEGVRQLAKDPDGLGERQPAGAAKPLLQGLAVDERHHEVERRPVGSRVEQRQDVWMLELCGGLDLGQKTVGADDGRDVRLQNLDRDVTIVFQIASEIDDAHSAFAQLVQHAVWADGFTNHRVHLCWASARRTRRASASVLAGRSVRERRRTAFAQLAQDAVRAD